MIARRYSITQRQFCDIPKGLEMKSLIAFVLSAFAVTAFAQAPAAAKKEEAKPAAAVKKDEAKPSAKPAEKKAEPAKK